jgi:hypothetical protein
MLALDLPLVTASGALIKHPLDHRTLFRAAFDRRLLCDLLAVVERRGFEAVLYADSYHDGFDFYCPRVEVGRYGGGYGPERRSAYESLTDRGFVQ